MAKLTTYAHFPPVKSASMQASKLNDAHAFVHAVHDLNDCANTDAHVIHGHHKQKRPSVNWAAPVQEWGNSPGGPSVWNGCNLWG